MNTQKNDESGYVYVLISPKSEYIKIGGTDYPPLKRIREINRAEPYKSLGPWHLADFRQVTEWRAVEANLHYSFRSKLVKSIHGQKELFSLPAQQVSAKLNEIDSIYIIKKPKLDRFFQDKELADYVMRLFKFTGLMNWLDIQGAWTFTLFPSTNGGRYFTLSIGKHEVAFSTLPIKDEKPMHMLVMDRLILDFVEVTNWVVKSKGEVRESIYATALPRAVSISLEGSFEKMNRLLKMDGVRRALIAYWSEALIGLSERNSLSVFAKHHNWNAVAELYSRMMTEQPKG